MAESPDDIVGHKTFDTGETGKYGQPILRHEPLTRAEGDALWAAAEAERKHRAETMPTEKDAVEALWQAHQRLKELGWKEAVYCPKDGSRFQIIEAGSTGIFDAFYSGEWPDGYIIADDCVSRPGSTILCKLSPEAQAKEDARRAAIRSSKPS